MRAKNGEITMWKNILKERTQEELNAIAEATATSGESRRTMQLKYTLEDIADIMNGSSPLKDSRIAFEELLEMMAHVKRIAKEGGFDGLLEEVSGIRSSIGNMTLEEMDKEYRQIKDRHEEELTDHIHNIAGMAEKYVELQSEVDKLGKNSE